MRWLTLYNKIGKQQVHITGHCDVTLATEHGEVPLALKFDNMNRPYFEIDANRKTYSIMDKSVCIQKEQNK